MGHRLFVIKRCTARGCPGNLRPFGCSQGKRPSLNWLTTDGLQAWNERKHPSGFPTSLLGEGERDTALGKAFGGIYELVRHRIRRPAALDDDLNSNQRPIFPWFFGPGAASGNQ